MFDGQGVVYLYDGTFDGMLCCVFESFLKKETPIEIRTDAYTLFPLKTIATDQQIAARVAAGIVKKISRAAFQRVRHVFLCSFDNKELAIVAYLKFAFSVGRKADSMLTEPCIAEINRMERAVMREKHAFIEFMRFSDYGGALLGVFEPEHAVLPLLAGHFIARFPEESFMIYDRTHGACLCYENHMCEIVAVDAFDLAKPTEEEKKYRKLWKMFYDTIEVKERHNERCRMGHMPKKYWKHMTEFCDIDH